MEACPSSLCDGKRMDGPFKDGNKAICPRFFLPQAESTNAF
jgi:hypothetical protein